MSCWFLVQNEKKIKFGGSTKKSKIILKKFAVRWSKNVMLGKTTMLSEYDRNVIYIWFKKPKILFIYTLNAKC